MTKKAWIISIIAFVLGISIAISSLAIFTDVFKKEKKVKNEDEKYKIDYSIYAVSQLNVENLKYLKKLNKEVEITIVGTEEEFIEGMKQYAYYNYGIEDTSDKLITQYFDYTIAIIRKYEKANDKISVKYIDPQSTEFTPITTKYSDENLMYGSIIVSNGAETNERVKVLNFDDIYITTDANHTTGQAGSITGSKIESALTGAIAYVASEKEPKVAFLKGHSPQTDASEYQQLLEKNDYDVSIIEDRNITRISSDYDAIIISAPTVDFTTSEINVISAFLENDGKKGKGLIFFADAAYPPLPNLYNFLKQWGIEINEGVLFETNSNYMPSLDNPSTLVFFPQSMEDDTIDDNISGAVAAYVVPMKVCEDSSLQREAKSIMNTTDTVVVAPTGADKTWSDPYAKKQSFDAVIQSVETDYDKNNKEITSYVMAFASVEFVESDWALQGALSNQDIVMACTERAAHIMYEEFAFLAWVGDKE